jgi:DNA polymerase-3 subunit gamma/tau
VVRVAGTWMAMVQSRLPLLEKALAGALGSGRQLVLEPGGELKAASAAVKASPLLASPPVSAPAPIAPSAGPEPARLEPAAAAPAPTEPMVAAAPSEPMAVAAPAVAAAAAPVMPTPLEEKAKRLAEFFNGEVIEDVSDQVA